MKQFPFYTVFNDKTRDTEFTIDKSVEGRSLKYYLLIADDNEKILNIITNKQYDSIIVNNYELKNFITVSTVKD